MDVLGIRLPSGCRLLQYTRFEGESIHLTDARRADVEESAGTSSAPKMALLLAKGVFARAVETKVDVSRPTIVKWRGRFLEHGIESLNQPSPGPGAVEVDGAGACLRADRHTSPVAGPADALVVPVRRGPPPREQEPRTSSRPAGRTEPAVPTAARSTSRPASSTTS